MTLVTAIKAIAASSWLLVVGLFILMAVRASRQESNKRMTSLFVVILIVAAALNVVAAGIVFIEPTERGVVITPFDEKGIRTDAIQPGLRLIVPFAENVVTYPISRQSYTMSIASAEGQISGDDFFTSLQAATATIARDPNMIKHSIKMADTGLIPEFLIGLPYQSQLMAIDNELWASWSADEQNEFINALNAKVEAYRTIHDTPDGWIPLNKGDDIDEYVYPLSLDLLP